MPIRRLAAMAGISVPVTECAIQTAIFLHKSKRHGNAITVRVMAILAMAAVNTTAVVDIAVAGIPYPAAATELISISGMAVAIPRAPCHPDFKTAAIIDRRLTPSAKHESAGPKPRADSRKPAGAGLASGH